MKTVSELLDNLVSELPSEDLELCMENRFPYIFTKSFYFLQDGPELYKQKDAFSLPDNSFSNKDIEKIKSGCQQLLEGKGFKKEHPIIDLGIKPCHKLFELFHFEFVKQTAIRTKTGQFLDEMTFQHVIDKSIVIYYNLV